MDTIDMQSDSGTTDRAVRTELAALYRLAAHYGWSDLTYAHISARAPGASDHYFINSYGFLFEEVTASSLLRMSFDGELMSGAGECNSAGHAIHSGILKARPDINFVLHSHTVAGVAVSTMKCGLLPISQQANAILANVAYCTYRTPEGDPEESARIAASLGEKYLLILHDHGVLACGRTAGEAFLNHYFLQLACEIQVAALSGNSDPIVAPEESVRALSSWGAPRKRPWGEKQWVALLRKLDRLDPGFRD